MYAIFYGLVALLSAYGLRFVDCKPRFTRTPSSTNKVYVDEGDYSFALLWDYYSDGQTVTWVDLMYKNSVGDDVVIARKSANQQLLISPTSGYNGRLTFTGRATFTLWHIEKSDRRTFECKVYFSSIVNPWIKSIVELIVVVKPKITLKTTVPVTITEGDTRTLLCVASGIPKPLITWYRDSTKLQEDANNSNYTITSANKNHTGMYRCDAVVSAPGLGPYTTNYTVNVTVRYRPQHKANSLVRNETVYLGRDATFYCRTEAFPPNIQYSWFKGDNQISNSQEYTVNNFGNGESRLIVKQVKKSSAGRYSCYGRNDVGNGHKKSVFLTVHYSPQQITLTPDPAVVRLNQSITLTCKADALPPPRYLWKFNGNILSKAVKNNLTLTHAKVEDAGRYTCKAENFYGSKETTRVVNVEYQPTVKTFTTGTPKNTVIQGKTVNVTCTANGYPPPTYTIKRGNTIVNSTGGRFVISNIQLGEEDYTYSCEPNNTVGKGPVKQLKITVQVPPTLTQTLPAAKQTRKENETVPYTCTAEAKPAASITWMLNGKPLTNKPPFDISSVMSPPSQSNKLWETHSYLTIKKITWREGGTYSCLAFNVAGQTRQATELDIEYRPVVGSATDHPKNHTLEEGQTARFTCKTIGNPATQSHKWQFNGVDIPGQGCKQCLRTTFTKPKVNRSDTGWYSCTGTNTLGEGPPARAHLLVKYRPQITYVPHRVYTVNETNNVSMVCRADSVPQPTITWIKTGNSEILSHSEQFQIFNTSSRDDGTYTCIAKNYLGNDSREITLNVQTRPVIVTTTTTVIQIPGAEGEKVDLTCTASGKPPPSLSWKRQLDGNDLTSLHDDKVQSITLEKEDTSVMKVTVSAVGEKFYCVAVNLLGIDNQEYTIREKGAPDAPTDMKLVAFRVGGAKTVSVNISWTPGYSGGYDQVFTVHYRVKGSDADLVEESVGNPDNNMCTIQGLYPKTQYEFTIQASNQAGKSQASALTQVTTPVSSVPPDIGTVTATRMPNDVTVILVTWTVTDPAVTTLSLEMQEGGEGQWKPVDGASGLSSSTTEFKVTDLKVDKSYRFRMDMRRPGKQNAVYVLSEVVPAGPIPAEKDDGKMLPNWMIAVIAGGGGVLLLVIVIIALCCFKRRRKKTVGDNKHPTSSYVVGGPDIAPATDRGRESVEDDPFIVAASMQSLNSVDGRKEKPSPIINYGYSTEDSVQQQPEMLLNPGSRLSSKSDINSGYPARGPQRDFKTFGTSLELVETANHENADQIDNPLYTAVDQHKSDLEPRVPPLGSKTNGPTKGPLDPTVAYAVPQKKNKSKKSRRESYKTAMEPPQKCSSEERPLDEPMAGDLDLDDPFSLPPSEKPLDQPTPIAMLPSNRTKPNIYHDDPNDGSPGPPAFFYIPDKKDQHNSDRAKTPYNPHPSGQKSRQPYANINGQVVRPYSQYSDRFRKPESLRSPRNTFTPKSEIPPNQRQLRGSESNDREAADINYVSCVV